VLKAHVKVGAFLQPRGATRRPQAGEHNRGVGVCKVADLASVRRLLSQISGSGAAKRTDGFCAPVQLDLRRGAEAGAGGLRIGWMCISWLT